MNYIYLFLFSICFFQHSAVSSNDDWKDTSPEEIEAMLMKANHCSPIEFRDIDFKEGKKFSRDQGTAFIECSQATCNVNSGHSGRSFTIKSKASNTDVGSIDILYLPGNREVEISHLEIKAEHRRQGYAEAALRTILGVFRSKQQSSLGFDNFSLNVPQVEQYQPARALYEKVGFKVQEDVKNQSFYKMILNR